MEVEGGGGSAPGGPDPAEDVEDVEDVAEDVAERPLPCRNCHRRVSPPNLALHEAHCLRFLALCPECQEPVALKAMEEHLHTDHRKVRCQLCHRAMQKYQLQEHTAEECPERTATCGFCELTLPFRRLGAHLEACGSRTTRCWDCGKYVMYRALKGHGQECQGSGGPGGLRPEAKTSFCQRWVPEERHLQHTDECCPLPRLLGALSTNCPPGPGSPPPPSLRSPPTEKGARPKRKDKDLPPILGKPSLKPPRSKKALARLAFTPTAAPPQTTAQEEEEGAYDPLASCPHCHILLPSPTLQSHQKKCQRRTPSLQAQRRRRSPRFLDKGEEPQMQSPPGENSWQ